MKKSSIGPNFSSITFENMDSNDLTQSQMDLLLHGPGHPTGISSVMQNQMNEINADTPDVGPVSIG